jgi:hypothetical protein
MVPAMTSAARDEAAYPFDHLVPVPELRDVEIPFDQAPGLTELAVRAPTGMRCCTWSALETRVAVAGHDRRRLRAGGPGRR